MEKEKIIVKILEDIKVVSSIRARQQDTGEVVRFYNNDQFSYVLVRIKDKLVSVPVEWVEIIN